jgi:hypothetical protein
MLKLSKLERHGRPTIRAGPTYRWIPRGLHAPTAGLNTNNLVSPSVNFFWEQRDEQGFMLGGQKERILFFRLVIVTYISRLLDTDRYSVESDAPTFLQVSNRYLYLPPTGHG